MYEFLLHLLKPCEVVCHMNRPQTHSDEHDEEDPEDAKEVGEEDSDDDSKEAPEEEESSDDDAAAFVTETVHLSSQHEIH